jgi:hydrogenase maturation protease
VLGVGNPILRDDGLGVRLAEDYVQRANPRDDVEVIAECSQGGLSLLDVIAGYDRLVVFDSMMTTGGVPGTWSGFTAAALRHTLNLGSVHDANLATTLELGRYLGYRIPAPEQIWIYGVEVADNLTFAESFSPQLEAAYPQCRDEILAEVEALLGTDPLTRRPRRRNKPRRPRHGRSQACAAPGRTAHGLPGER